MPKMTIRLTFVACLLSGFFVLLAQSWDGAIVLRTVVAWICVIAIVATPLAWAIGVFSLQRFGGLPREEKAVIPAFVVVCIAQACLIAAQIEPLWLRSDVADAQRYCARIRPELERYKRVYGRYPRQLSRLEIDEPVPRLMRDAESYRSWDVYYEFQLRRPRKTPLQFDSRTGLWLEVAYGFD
jgi:hypothetical protein